MDCDDALILLARPDHDQQESLEEHLAGCAACRELRDRDDEVDGEGETEAAPAPITPGRIDDVGALIGRVIGSYEVTKVLGSGGMGVVYLAVHPEIGSRVAIKVFSRDWSKHPRLVARFFAEARATSVIAHENIVNVLDVGRLDDGRPYLMMEYLTGRPLTAMIGSRELTDDVTQRLMLRVLGALAAAHERGIVHRDLKPDNIFVSPELSPTLLDFGIAKLRPDLTRGMTETVTGAVLGTPQYMSPEQARGDAVDERADLYAIGVILYECLLGRRPFAAASTYLLLEQQVHRPPIPPRRIRPELGADLEQVILTALAKDPEDRFESAHELQVALAACRVATDRGAFAVVEDAWTLATVEGSRPVGRAPRASSRKAAVVAAVGAAGVVAALATWQLTGSPAPADPSLAVAATDGGVERAVVTVPTPDTPPLATTDAAAIDASAIADAPVPAVSVRSAAQPQPSVRPPASRGTAPLSLLASSDAVARAKQADAVLARVIVRSPTPDGLIDRSAGGSVTFDFISPSRVARLGDNSRCVVRVIFGAAPAPQVEWLTTNQCTRLHPLPPPRCSLAAVLSAAASRKKLPPGPATMATLRMSLAESHRRPLWKIVVNKVEHDVELDIVSC